MNNIKTVTIVGSNGAMGSGVAGLVASFGGAQVYMVARTIEKARESIEAAVRSVRSDSIRERLNARTFEDLEQCVSRSDWVFESVAENLDLKLEVNRRIATACNDKTIISTGTSGLSINKLSNAFPARLKMNYCGTHFYNPPYKMALCELILTDHSAEELSVGLREYLKRVLLRRVVVVKDLPAFAGNRVGFQFMNEALQKAQVESGRGGLDYIDALLGTYTGRALPPLMTVDFVGLDIHKAIVDNIYKNTNDSLRETFAMPEYVQALIQTGKLGVKAGAGLYQRKAIDGVKKSYVYDIGAANYRLVETYQFAFAQTMKELIRTGEYKKACDTLLKDQSHDSSIIKHSLLRYVSYSLAMVGPVVDTKEDMDIVMMTGYNWVPPSVFVDLFGGGESIASLMRDNGVEVPQILQDASGKGLFYTLQEKFDYRRYFRAR